MRCGSQLCTHHQKEAVAYASSITGWNTARYRLSPLPHHNTLVHTLLGVCTVTLGGRKSNEWDVKLCLVASCVNHTHTHTDSQSFSVATGRWTLMVLKSWFISYQRHHWDARPLGFAQSCSQGMNVRVDGWIWWSFSDGVETGYYNRISDIELVLI